MRVALLRCHLESEAKLPARPTSRLHSHAACKTGQGEVQKEPDHDTAQGTDGPGAINRCTTSAQRHSERAFDGVHASWWKEQDVVTSPNDAYTRARQRQKPISKQRARLLGEREGLGWRSNTPEKVPSPPFLGTNH